MLSEYGVYSDEVANKIGKTEDKSYSGHRLKANGDAIKDVLLFTAFSGIFLSFLFLIWNISSGHWDFGTSGFEIVIIILVIIFVILLKKRK